MKTKSRSEKPIKVSDQEHERLKAIGFQKGQSGNPKGRPPLPAEVKEAMASHSMEAIDVLLNVMRSSENDAAKVKAATHILAPFVSKAPQQIDVDVNVSHFGDFLARAGRRLQQAPSEPAPLIDVTPEHTEQ